MIIHSTKFKDLKVIKLKKFSDLRGENIKIFNRKYKNLKFQCFESYISISKKGTARGLHGQSGKFSQSKLIYCIKGKVLDVAIDLRKKSATYGKVFKKTISHKDLTAIIIPRGFVHGVVALENDTIVINFNSTDYNPKKQFGININSLNLKIPKIKLRLSKKDKKLMKLKDFINKRK